MKKNTLIFLVVVAAGKCFAQDFSSVYITANRTITVKQNQTCSDRTKKSGTISTTFQVALNSDSVLVTKRGDYFNMDVSGGEVKKGKQFSGDGTLNYITSTTQINPAGDNGGGGQDVINGNETMKMDMKQLHVAFTYDKKKGQGEFSLTTSYIDPSGKCEDEHTENPHDSTYWGGSPPHSISQKVKGHNYNSDLTTTQNAFMAMQGTVFGNFSAKNYNFSQMANIPPQYAAQMQQVQKALDVPGNPNGGMCNISVTTTGYEMGYSYSTTVDLNANDPTHCDGTNEEVITTTVSISIGSKPKQYEAILEPKTIGTASGDYDNWIPMGPPVKQTESQQIHHGNSLGLDVYLVDKNKPDQKETGVKYDVTYTLTGVSYEPGYCLNYPKNSANNKPDLQFDSVLQKANGSYSISEVSSKGLTGESYLCIITSYDYGSFGKLKVEVTLESGTRLEAHFKNEVKTEIPIPKDDNNNQIADAWEKLDTINVFQDNHSPFWDSEKQKLNGHAVNDNDGDGLTMYEEYRGMTVNGEYRRLNPNYKKLFVLNQIGPKALTGMGLFTSASGIHIIQLTSDDIDAYDLVVNQNSVFAKGGSQHGVLLKYFLDADSTTEGATGNKEGDKDRPPTSPGDCTSVKINQNHVFENDADFAITVAHELAHSCGVKHHGTAPDLAPPDKNSIDSTYRIYAINGSKAAPESYAQIEKDGFLGAIAGPGSLSCGDMHCIMAYDHQYAWAAPIGVDGKIFINVDLADDCSKTEFCNSSAGTYWNDPNHKPYPVYGNAQNGDCIHQFLVKDW